MNIKEQILLMKLKNVQSYVLNLKGDEPGYIYDNIDELEQLNKEIQSINTKEPEIIEIYSFLCAEIDEFKRRTLVPIRTADEEVFYRHIVGINSYIRETKKKDSSYIFDNITEAKQLLSILAQINTKDPDILAIMNIITKDILVVLQARGSFEELNQLKEALKSLGVGLEQNKQKTI